MSDSPDSPHAHVLTALRAALAQHIGVTLPVHEHTHECTESCGAPCRHAKATYRYGPLPVPRDHVLLEWYTLPDGGRIMKDMHVDVLAGHLSEHAHEPMTHASAHAALAKKHTALGKDTGVGQYLDKWHDEGLLP